jgi:hypothetical protein
MRYALVRNGVVANVIIWDGVQPYSAGDSELIELGELVVGPGFTYVGGVFEVPPPPPEPEPTE